MRRLWFIASVLEIFVGMSCQPKDTQKEVQYHIGRLFYKLNHSLKVNQDYLLIPLDGCGSCVDESIAFSKAYRQSPRITFIVSSTMGKKIINLRYPVNSPFENIIKDDKGIVSNDSLIQNRVCYLKVRNGSVQVFSVIPPQEVKSFLISLGKALQKI